MNSKIFTYLKRKGMTDIRMVNRLFVSAFMRHHHLVPHKNALLVEHYIGDVDEDASALTEFIEQLDKCECKYSLEDLTILFEFVISPSDRRITGAIYTPHYIREKIVEEVTEGLSPDELATKRFADIACGCGGFFLTIAQLLKKQSGKPLEDIFRDNIFGIDIQEYSIQRTKLLLSLLALMNGEDKDFIFHLYQANSLSFDFGEIEPLNIIVGNPPYVCARHMSDENRVLLSQWSVCASGNSDLYIPFFQIATESVIDGGRVGLITMNSFLTSLNGRALREYFHGHGYDIRIVDFRDMQMFPGRNTYTCLFFLTKIHSESVRYCTTRDITLKEQFEFDRFCYSQLNSIDGWKLNSLLDTNHIESVGNPLKQYSQTRHGIATLANKVYVFQPIREEGARFVFVKNGTEYTVEQSICRKIINSNRFNSEAQLCDIIEQVIYPYQNTSEGKIKIIDEDIMRHKYPLAYAYLVAHRPILDARDKGHTEKYPAWYAYGRTQSLTMPRYKLFFPKIANKQLHCIFSDDCDLLLYNGIAFVSNDATQLLVLKRIMESSIFWNYVTLNSKPYSSGYYSLNGINIKNFGIPKFTSEQKQTLLAMKNQREINNWLEKFYK